MLKCQIPCMAIIHTVSGNNLLNIQNIQSIQNSQPLMESQEHYIFLFLSPIIFKNKNIFKTDFPELMIT